MSATLTIGLIKQPAHKHLMAVMGFKLTFLVDSKIYGQFASVNPLYNIQEIETSLPVDLSAFCNLLRYFCSSSIINCLLGLNMMN